MRNLLVKDSHQSKGVGKLLFNAVLNVAKENGCNRLELHVNNKSSVRKFYEKLGAINVSERDGHMYYRVYRDVISQADV